uniref:Uncharacterized protein n=1 Tax=Biomphalaria glabrata TaxID=6526 RepID=A0A2C9LEK6_BIOGL
MPSPGRGFCLGLRMDGNENIAATTVSTLPLHSHTASTRTWQGNQTIPLNSRDQSYSSSLDNDRSSIGDSQMSSDSTVDNISPSSTKATLSHPSTLIMEPGPVIKMGTGALGQRKGLVHKEVSSWKDVSPKSESSSPTSSPNNDGTNVGKLGNSPCGEGRTKVLLRSPVKSGNNDANGTNSNISSSKNGPKKQSSISKSPRATRKFVSGAKNSNLSTSPKKPSMPSSSSSSSSFEATSPKRGKINKGKSHYGSELDTGQLDKLKLADKYKISETVDFSKATPIIEALNAKVDKGHSNTKALSRLTTWKDISPTESKIEGATPSHTDKRSRPESGYFSNEVHSESREGMDGSLSSESDHAGTIKHRPKIKKDNQKDICTSSDTKTVLQETDKIVDTDQRDTPDQTSCPCNDSEDTNGYTDGIIPNSSSHCPPDKDAEESAERQTVSKHGGHADLSKPLPSHVAMMEESESSSSSPRHWRNIREPGPSGSYSSDPRYQRPELSSLTSMDNSDSFDHNPDQRASQDDSSFNDYFFDEDFIVQFDGNLQSSVGVILQGSCAFSLADSLAPAFQGRRNNHVSSPGQQALLPHSFNGSYPTYGALRDSFLQNEDLYSGPCESEVSGTGSRTSMDVSSSEREMMCSSDMLDFPGNEPLFTPPVITSQDQNLSTDSLSRQLEATEGEVAAAHSLSGSRSSSTTADITVKCGPHKDAYFLSFDGGSQGKFSTESESSYVSQTSSQDDKLGSRSMSSGGEAEDEQSSSFQFANLKSRNGSVGTGNSTALVPAGGEGKGRLCTWNMKGSRYPGRICLEALQEYLSQSSGSPGSLSQSAGSHKLSPLCAALLSSGELEKHCAPKQSNGSFIKRSGRLTTWKQIRNLRNLGKTKDLNVEKSKSLPELTTNSGFSEETTDEEEVSIAKEKSRRDADNAERSFHHKRHSSYVLDLYQRLRSQSNPPSPDTLAKIDQILLREGFLNADDLAGKGEAQQQQQQQSHQQQRSCCHSAATSCDSACSSGHYPFYNMCVQRSDILQKRAQLRADFENREKLHLDLKMADTATNTPPHAKTGCTQTLRSLRLMTSKETLMSPSTVTLWLGTRNFSSQFPPKTQDFGLQTSLEGLPETQLNHQAQQTSPYTPERDLFSLLEEVCARYSKDEEQGQIYNRDYRSAVSEQDDRAGHNSDSPYRRQVGQSLDSRPYGSVNRLEEVPMDYYGEAHHCGAYEVRETSRSPQKMSPSHQMHRAASANDCHMARVRASEIYRNASLSPSRMGLNSYYTHRSLPDLSFLREKRKSFLSSLNEGGDHNPTSPDSSLFDPVKIPIILSPIVDMESTRSHSCSPCRSQSCSPSRRQTVSCCSCTCSQRSHSSPAKTADGFSNKSKSFTGCSPTKKQHGSSPLRCAQAQYPNHSSPDLYVDHCLPDRAQHMTNVRLKNSPVHALNKPRSSSYETLRDQQTKLMAMKKASSMSNTKTTSRATQRTPASNTKTRAVSHSPSCSRLLRSSGQKTNSNESLNRQDLKENIASPVGQSSKTSKVEKVVRRTDPSPFNGEGSDDAKVAKCSSQCDEDGSGHSGGSGGFTPTYTQGPGNTASSKSLSSTSSCTSSSSSSSKKVTSGQYVVSCFSSSSASSCKSDQRSSSTSTIESKSHEEENSGDGEPQGRVVSRTAPSGQRLSALSAKLQKQSSTESDSNSVRLKSFKALTGKENNADLAKQKTGLKRGKIPVPITRSQGSTGSSSSIASSNSGYVVSKPDVKATSKLPMIAKGKEAISDKKSGSKFASRARDGNNAKYSSPRLKPKQSQEAMADAYNHDDLHIVESDGQIPCCENKMDERFVNRQTEDDIVSCNCQCNDDQHLADGCGAHGHFCDLEPPLECMGCECTEDMPPVLQEILGEDCPTSPCCHCSHADALNENDAGDHNPIIDGRGCMEISKDLERILFQPPHLESSLERESMKDALACNDCEDLENKDVSVDGECCKMIELLVEDPPNVMDHLKMYNSLTDMKTSASGNALLAKKISDGVHRHSQGDTKTAAAGNTAHTVVAVPAAHKLSSGRVVNEAYPTIPRHDPKSEAELSGPAKSSQQHRMNARRRWSTGSSLNTYNFDALYSLQEESGHSSASSNLSSYDDFTPQHSSSFCKEIWNGPYDHHAPCCHDSHHHHHHHDENHCLSDPSIDEELMRRYHKWLQERKPLKSCLRKTASGTSIDVHAPVKPPRVNAGNRHSIACDGNMPILVSEEGFPQYDLVTMNAVVRRRKPKHRSRHSPSSSSTSSSSTYHSTVTSSNSSSATSEDSAKLKRVSFASEVSFHSPHQSPKRPSEESKPVLEVEAIEMGGDLLTLHLVEGKKNRSGSVSKKPATSDLGTTTTTTVKPATEPAPPAASTFVAETSVSLPVDSRSIPAPAVVAALVETTVQEPTASLMENNNLSMCCE